MKHYFKRILLITLKAFLSVLITEHFTFAKEIINRRDEFKANDHFFKSILLVYINCYLKLLSDVNTKK